VGNHILREGSPESVGMDSARVKRLSELVAGWVKNGDTPSVVVLVARRGVVVLHDAFGVRHHGDTTPTLRPDAIFQVASISKPITAAAIMCLVEDGLIGLNRPFVEYVPELDVPGVPWLEEARVADLLCHTAGYDELAVLAYVNEAAQKSTPLPPPAPGQHPMLNQLIRLAIGAPLARRPGTAMIYSPFGYRLLGDIVRRVSGRPFWQFVRERIFEPLGMRDSAFVLPPELRGRRVYRAPGMPGTRVMSPYFRGLDSTEQDEVDWGNNGCTSTARDLAVFGQMLLNNGSYGGRQILSRASVAAMTRDQSSAGTPQIVPRISATTGERIDMEQTGGGYGYGLFIMSAGDRYGENGGLGSLSAYGHVGFGGTCLWAEPEQELVGVYLSISPRMHRDWYTSNADLFQNAVHAAIID
jgi:CubicO group peptidase (beta-lactamase class C family)